jgi:hypothetical protein
MGSARGSRAGAGGSPARTYLDKVHACQAYLFSGSPGSRHSFFLVPAFQFGKLLCLNLDYPQQNAEGRAEARPSISFRPRAKQSLETRRCEDTSRVAGPNGDKETASANIAG